MIDESIGRYSIVSEIGRGGFAEVYLARDPNFDAPVAIKILAQSFSSDPDVVARFIAEARVMRSLAAPGLVTVFDSAEHDGRPYLVMEYCERGTLDDRLRILGRPLTVEEGLGLARAMAAAISGVHRADPPVVHRDVKPGNLLVRHTPRHRQTAVGELLAADEELILADFGLAKVVDPSATKVSMIAYTRGFAAPEQTRGDPAIGPSADVYAASAVIAACVSGVAPLPVMKLGDAAFDEDALAATGFLRPGIEQGLAFDSRQRPPGIDAWVAGFAATPPVALAVPADSEASSPVETSSPVEASLPVETSSPVEESDAAETLAPAQARHRLRRAATVVAALLVLVVSAVLFQLTTGGPRITGPTTGFVEDQVAFAMPDATVIEWSAGGEQRFEPVVAFTPTEPGRVRISAKTEDGVTQFDYLALERTSEIRIEGPGHLPVGKFTVLSVSGAEGQQIEWTVAGQTKVQETLQLRPTTPGVTLVQVTTADGRSVERVFTAADS